MKTFTMKSTFVDKCKEAIRLLKTGSISALFRRCIRYASHLFGDKSRFVYFAFSLDKTLPNFHLNDVGNVCVAEPKDADRIKFELFPFITEEEENDKRYFKLLGTPKISCFLAEKDGILIHYTWLFWDAMHSPLIDTAFPKTWITQGDGYVGPAFTSPLARGTWIYPYVLMKLLLFAKETARLKRIILFVNGKNASAVNFFERLGFERL